MADDEKRSEASETAKMAAKVKALKEQIKAYEAKMASAGKLASQKDTQNDEGEPKRKRGRPRKVVDPDAPLKPKGKRGRPRKQVDPNAPLKVKGKRGRPRKVVDADAPLKPKGKRGRPRKNPLLENLVESSNDKNQGFVTDSKVFRIGAIKSTAYAKEKKVEEPALAENSDINKTKSDEEISDDLDRMNAEIARLEKELGLEEVKKQVHSELNDENLDDTNEEENLLDNDDVENKDDEENLNDVSFENEDDEQEEKDVDPEFLYSGENEDAKDDTESDLDEDLEEEDSDDGLTQLDDELAKFEAKVNEEDDETDFDGDVDKADDEIGAESDDERDDVVENEEDNSVNEISEEEPIAVHPIYEPDFEENSDSAEDDDESENVETESESETVSELSDENENLVASDFSAESEENSEDAADENDVSIGNDTVNLDSNDSDENAESLDDVGANLAQKAESEENLYNNTSVEENLNAEIIENDNDIESDDADENSFDIVENNSVEQNIVKTVSKENENKDSETETKTISELGAENQSLNVDVDSDAKTDDNFKNIEEEKLEIETAASGVDAKTNDADSNEKEKLAPDVPALWTESCEIPYFDWLDAKNAQRTKIGYTRLIGNEPVGDEEVVKLVAKKAKSKDRSLQGARILTPAILAVGGAVAGWFLGGNYAVYAMGGGFAAGALLGFGAASIPTSSIKALLKTPEVLIFEQTELNNKVKKFTFEFDALLEKHKHKAKNYLKKHFDKIDEDVFEIYKIARDVLKEFEKEADKNSYNITDKKHTKFVSKYRNSVAKIAKKYKFVKQSEQSDTIRQLYVEIMENAQSLANYMESMRKINEIETKNYFENALNGTLKTKTATKKANSETKKEAPATEALSETEFNALKEKIPYYIEECTVNGVIDTNKVFETAETVFNKDINVKARFLIRAFNAESFDDSEENVFNVAKTVLMYPEFADLVNDETTADDFKLGVQKLATFVSNSASATYKISKYQEGLGAEESLVFVKNYASLLKIIGVIEKEEEKKANELEKQREAENEKKQEEDALFAAWEEQYLETLDADKRAVYEDMNYDEKQEFKQNVLNAIYKEMDLAEDNFDDSDEDSGQEGNGGQDYEENSDVNSDFDTLNDVQSTLLDDEDNEKVPQPSLDVQGSENVSEEFAPETNDEMQPSINLQENEPLNSSVQADEDEEINPSFVADEQDMQPSINLDNDNLQPSLSMDETNIQPSFAGDESAMQPSVAIENSVDNGNQDNENTAGDDVANVPSGLENMIENGSDDLPSLPQVDENGNLIE